MELTVRPLGRQDFDSFADYWLQLSPIEIARLGIAASRLPSREQMRNDVERMLETPESMLHTFIVVWCADGAAIGHSSLKDIVRNETGNMHLHLWREDLRRKGYGAQLFCLSALQFYRRFNLQRIVCEPKRDNSAPNRMLQRIGFPLIRTRLGSSSELSTVCELNAYLIDRAVAEACLKQAGRFT